jgi:predicted RNase H-like nuclease (RuvC/YqgF family)
MVSAAADVGFTPPLKFGHSADAKPGDPAIGWVKNLRRSGSKLIADFIDLPVAVYEAIKQRSFDTLSCEIFWDYSPDGKKTFNRALKAVSLLGADIPAVKNLRPLREVVFGEATAWGAVKTYEQALTEFDEGTHSHTPSGGAATDNQGGDAMDPEVKKLTEQLETANKAIETKDKELKARDEALATKDKEVAGKLATLAEKTTELDALRAKFGDASPQVKSLAETVDKLHTQLTEVRGESAKHKKTVDDLTEQNRQGKIKTKSAACRVPAFRPTIAALYDITTRQPDALVKVYASDGTAKDSLAETVVDELVSTINRATEHLFIQQSTIPELRRDDAPTSDNPREAVDLRVKRYMQDHPKTSYTDAREAVFAADPPLKEAYANS